MKRLLVALLTIGLVLGLTTPASAARGQPTYKTARNCYVHSVGWMNIRNCISVNVHDFWNWKEGLLELDTEETPNNIELFLDYVLVYMDGSVVAREDPVPSIWWGYGNEGFDGPSLRDSGWYEGDQCLPGDTSHTFRGSARYRLRNSVTGAVGVWHTIYSDVMTQDCPG